MRSGITTSRALAATVALCLVAGAATAGGPVAVRLSEDQLEALAGIGGPEAPPVGPRHPKIATVLLEIAEIERLRADWRGAASQRGLLVEGESVLVELRLDPEAAEAARWRLERLGGTVRHHVVPSLMEAWLPVRAIEEVAGPSDVLLVRPARLVEPTVGSVTSEGVAALNVGTSSVDYDYHDLGADGTGILIANIDAGYAGYAALQASGDWPQPASLRRFEIDGGPVTDCDVVACSDYEADDHGATTMELVFDVAPGAEYLTYRTTTVGDWYTALVDAADRGADIVTVSLSAPLDNIGDGSTCPLIWPAPCGTIAEAAAYARSQGTLVVNSAGNYRQEHWGGTYVDSGGALNWDGAGAVYNIGGPGGGSVYCYPNGYPLGVDLFWDDWTDVDHDYDLYLYEYRGNNRWRLRASSAADQSGAAGQTPQEGIRYTVTGALGGGGICPSGSGIFAIRVSRFSTPSNRNLQVFAGNWGGLWSSTPDRSLGFPADSPAVFAVGAVDVTAPGNLEDYSSEGPVLGPGGSQAAPSPANPKPDGVSVSGVSSVTYGPSGFGGTSSAAPHTAGIAAILTQLRDEKYATPPATDNPDGIHDLLATFALEDSTFPAVHATTYGHGLVKLRFCDQSVGVADGEWIMLGLPCNRRAASTVAEVLGDDLDLVGTYWEVWEQGDTYGSYIQLFEDDLMVPGEGYWLLYEGNATADIQGLVADRSEAYPLPLRGESLALGWANFLGHPFELGVDWPDVTVLYDGAEHSLADAVSDGKIRNFMWGPYTATGYVENDGLLGEGTLAPFAGFWVKAFEDVELRVPTSLAVDASEGQTEPGQAIGWTVRLEATSLGKTATARLGQLPDGEPGWDVHDAEHMPSFEPHQLAVVMPHPEWGELAGSYVRDYHGKGRVQSWRFEVRSNLGGKVELGCGGPRSVLGRSVLTDLSTGMTITGAELAKSGYAFEMPPGARAFEWRVR
ncbi:MAG: S8 family serine peptidase [Thermoanaerobaculales bacterium]|jgi:hypothetical protein|nr:S8 family serine peptidase [Thermoanaerobaculales bacterium]